MTAALALLTACGGSSPQTWDEASAKVRALVPEEAVAFVLLHSLDAIDRDLQEIVRSFDGDATEASVDRLLEQLGPMIGDASKIDRTRPIGFAMSLPGGGMPAQTFVVPATDPAGYAASLPQRGSAEPVAEDGYVAFTLGGRYAKPATAAAITGKLPGGLIAARVDVEEIVATFRPMIALALGQAEQMVKASAQTTPMPVEFDIDAMMTLYLDAVRAIVDSGETLELAVSYADGSLATDLSLTALSGSKLDGWGTDAPNQLARVAATVDPEQPLVMLINADPLQLLERMQPFMNRLAEVYPEPIASMMTEAIDDFEPIYAAFGDVFAIDGTFGEGGMRLTATLLPDDAQALIDGYAGFAQSRVFAGMGLTFDAPSTSAVDGVEVRRFHVAFDYDKLLAMLGADANELSEAERAELERPLRALYGEDGLTLRFASKGDRTVMTIGGDDAYVQRAIGRLNAPAAGAPAPLLKRALESIGDANPCAAYRIDFAQLIRGMAQLGELAHTPPAEIPEDARAPMLMYVGIEDRTWRAGMVWDLLRFAESMGKTFGK